MKIMRTTLILTMLFFATMSAGQGKPQAECTGHLTVKEAGDWKITVYHNLDVKPGVTAPEPQ